jgi:alkylation response protein AidB-like acyl-CoA dehydrogenase
MQQKVIRKGGSFFLEDVPPGEVFTPEDFSDEHRMLIKTIRRFIENEVAPHVEEIEAKDWDLTRRLMRRAGELGLLGADVDEEYGGAQLDGISSLLIAENAGTAGSFGVTLSVHTGIGSMPLVFFGGKVQKSKYLPAMASGEAIAAYALTEPGAGSDALSIQATAALSPDGKHYVLNGAKQFITNGGIADVIFTYAKVDGDKMTAFVLEKGFEGVSTGPEEKKMGIRGSSTCSIFLDDARVPVENVLFEIGRGHIVAFNILNLGRFKVAAGCVGAAKLAIESGVGYARERVQFGRPVSQFGLMKHKIAEMATRTYVAESLLYRTGGLIDTILATVDRSAEDVGRQSATNMAEYAIECSMNKVYCSEMLAYVADEAVQMYGGYGYTEEYPVERIYRDCKIFRIYEGTNEINRVIISTWLTRRASKNEIPLYSVAERVKGEWGSMEPLRPGATDGPLDHQRRIVDRAKKLLVFLCDAAAQKYGSAIGEEQGILGPLSDIAIEVYAMESSLLRALKSIDTAGEQRSMLKTNMVRLYVNDAMARVAIWARQLTAAMESGDGLDSQLEALHRVSEYTPVNGVELRSAIADEIVEAGRYTC